MKEHLQQIPFEMVGSIDIHRRRLRNKGSVEAIRRLQKIKF
jgi:hypothetical protein